MFSKNNSLNGKAYIIGDIDGKAMRLAKDVGIEVDFGDGYDRDSVILVDDYAKYLEVSKKVKEAVCNGAKVIFAELPPGEYDILDSFVISKACSMQPVNFVARNTGHRYVDGFKNKDFRNWYDKSFDYITPILDSTLLANDFSPILTSGNRDNTGWQTVIAACDKSYGKGNVILCNVKLSGRTKENPVADCFAKRIISM